MTSKVVSKELLQEYFKDHMYGFFGYGCEISCWDGWNELIWDTLAACIELDPELKVIQIKEKFAGLDIHIDTENPEVWDICNEARTKSLTICESCGTMEAQGVSKGYWMKTMCLKCFEDWK